MLKGIDVSYCQTNIDWQKVKNSGVDFVIIRAGYGKEINQKDKQFENHYTGAKAAGLYVGAYHYSYARSVNEAMQEADCFLEWIKDKHFEMPVYFNNWIKCWLSLAQNKHIFKTWLIPVVLNWHWVIFSIYHRIM